MVIGVEDAHELAGHARQRGVHVLRLGHAALDPQRQEARIALGDLVEQLLDRQRLRRVVGEDHLQIRIVLPEERLDRLHHRATLVRQVGGDHGRCRRGRAGRRGRRLAAPQRGHALHPDGERRHREGHHQHEEGSAGHVDTRPVHGEVGEERQPEAEHLLQDDLQRGTQ
jgi:hypothetical protein